MLLPTIFSKNDNKHIYEAARLMCQAGYKPDNLYAFIFVSEGGSMLRLNTIHVNYLNILAGKC